MLAARHQRLLLLGLVLAAVSLLCALLVGSTQIPVTEVLRHLLGDDGSVND